IGYAYGVKGLFGVGSLVPMSLPSAIAFLILALGMLWAHPDRGLMASVTSDSSGGVLARRLIPACVIVPAVFGWLRLLGERAGLYTVEIGVSLNTIANIIFFVVLVWWTVGLLHRADAERQKTEKAL